ncbi:MAG: CHAT domain-containing protein [Thermodesulfobacteriota bacterium]
MPHLTATTERMLAFAILLVFLSVCFGPDHAGGTEIGRLYDEANQLLKKGAHQEAIPAFEKVMEACGKKPCRPIAAAQLGRALLEISRLEEALKYLDIAEEAFSQSTAPDAAFSRGVVLQLKGRAFSEQSAYQKALLHYDQAEKIFVDLLRQDPKAHRALFERELACAYANRALTMTHLYRYEDAKSDLEKAGQFLKTSDPGLVWELDKYKALIAVQSQDYPTAERLLSALLEKARARGDAKEEAISTYTLGHIDENLARYASAEARYAEALPLARKAGDRSVQAEILNHMAIVRYRRGNYEAARAAYQESLVIRQALGQKRQEAMVRANLGQLERAVADYPRSVTYLKEAAHTAEQHGYRDVLAVALEGQGFVLKDMGQFTTAETQLKRALALLHDLGDRRVEAITRLRLGNLQEYYGDFEPAVQSYRQAAEIQEEIDDRLFLTETSLDLANIQARQGDFAGAESSYEEALRLKRASGLPLGELLCRFALFYLEKPAYGQAPDRQNDLAQAALHLASADEAIGPDDRSTLLLKSYVRSRLFLEQEPQQAVSGFSEVESKAGAANNLRFLFLANVGLGLAYERLDRFREAEQAFEKGVRYAEGIRQTLDRQAKITFLQGEEIFGVRHVVPYEGLARVRMKMGAVQSSLEAAERTKARSFADSLARSMRGPCGKVDAATLDELVPLDEKLAATAAQLQRCSERQGDRSLVPGFTAALEELRGKREQLLDLIKAQDPEFFATRFGGTVTLDASALGPDEWILTYEVTESATLIYLTHGKTVVKGILVPVARKRLDRLVADFRRPFDAASLRSLADGSFLDAGHELFELLVAPFIGLVPEKTPLTVVPDDALGVVPFEMFPINRGGSIVAEEMFPRPRDVRFLGDRNPISYYQSLTALTLTRSGGARPAASGQKMLVLADPIIRCSNAPEEQRIASKAREADQQLEMLEVSPRPKPKTDSISLLSGDICSSIQSGLGRISETADLAGYLSRQFGGRVDPYTGGLATLGRFDRDIVPKLTQYDMVLFATHGILGDEFGLKEPALLLSMDPEGCDSWLKMSRIVELKMNAEIVALIACKSGLGKRISGEGPMGMGRAFQLAGSKSVLMSLWSVDVNASTELAKAFFEHLIAGQGKSEAFENARKLLREKDGGRYSHPFFWAGFVLVGER